MRSSKAALAAAIHDALGGARSGAVMADKVITALAAEGFAIVPTMPTVEMVAAVVQMTGDPEPEAWALAERAAGGTLGLPNVEGETACAELIRDWRNLIAAVPA